MSEQLRKRLFEALDAVTLIDPHTHINAHAPASTTLADILGYHYYTELAHSAGMPKARIEEPGLDPKEKVGRLVEHLGSLDNTIQYSWLIEMCQAFFGFQDEAITAANWEALYDRPPRRWRSPTGPRKCSTRSKLDAVFLDQRLRRPARRLRHASLRPLPADRRSGVSPGASRRCASGLKRHRGIERHDAATLRAAIGKLFEHFVAARRRACAISLPPDFTPAKVDAVACRGRGERRVAAGPEGRRRAADAICGTSCSGRWPSSAPSSSCRST